MARVFAAENEANKVLTGDVCGRWLCQTGGGHSGIDGSKIMTGITSLTPKSFWSGFFSGVPRGQKTQEQQPTTKLGGIISIKKATTEVEGIISMVGIIYLTQEILGLYFFGCLNKTIKKATTEVEGRPRPPRLPSRSAVGPQESDEEDEERRRPRGSGSEAIRWFLREREWKHMEWVESGFLFGLPSERGSQLPSELLNQFFVTLSRCKRSNRKKHRKVRVIILVIFLPKAHSLFFALDPETLKVLYKHEKRWG